VGFAPSFSPRFLDFRWFVFDEGWESKWAIVLGEENLGALKDILEKAMEKLRAA
jgi:hypothetical protein